MNVTKRLWVRLSIAFAAVVVVGFVTISVLSYFIIRASIEESGRGSLLDGLLNQLAAHYATAHSWEDSDLLLAGAESAYPRAFGEAIEFMLVSTDGRLLAGRQSPENSEAVTKLPVMLDNTTLAYLVVTHVAVRAPSRQPGLFRFLDLEKIILLVPFVGSLIGILVGIWMSRNLTAPLNELASAAEDIGNGKLDRRVQVEGTAEVMSLAATFNKMVDQLQRAETLRRNLVADVAHELRTPITALQTNIYAILDDAFPMTKSEITGLYEQTRMLSRLVKDLHELSQAESRQLPLDCKPLDLSQTLDELIAPFRPVADSKGIQFQVDIPAQLPLVLADEERINEVLHNLLSNALRHTPSGGSISVTARDTESWVCIAVKDTGEGIPPEHLPNIFERFYRADYARSRKTGGTGLGLAIAKAIVEAHDGHITAQSSGVRGEGATFTVQLPIYRPIAGWPRSEAAFHPKDDQRAIGQRLMAMSQSDDSHHAMDDDTVAVN